MMKPLRTLITLLLLALVALTAVAGGAGATATGQAGNRIDATVVAQLQAMQDPVPAPGNSDEARGAAAGTVRTATTAAAGTSIANALTAMLGGTEAPAPQRVEDALHAMLAPADG